MSQLPSSIDPNLLPSSEMTPAPAQKKLDSELPKTNKNQIKPSMKEEDNNNKDGDKADKKKKNHTWTDDQRVALVTFILDQIALGKGTDNGNLKAEAWNQVVKEMNTRFDIQFDQEQVKNQKGTIRKLYINMKFLLAQSGFGWNASTGMVTADNDTWIELIEAHPKRNFGSLRGGNIPWYELAQELFEGTFATGKTAFLPGQGPPSKPKPEDNQPTLGTSKPPTKQGRAADTAVAVDSSDNEKVKVVKNPTKSNKRVRESKYDILKSGVESIVNVLKNQTSQTDNKPNIKSDAVTKPHASTGSARKEAIQLIATIFFQKVPISDYIRFISVVESKASAEVFVFLASTTNPTVCQAWLKDVFKRS